MWKNSSCRPSRFSEELDVVDQQDVDLAVATLEGVAAVRADGVDELVEERLRGDVTDLVVLVVVVDVVADGVQQVGLAESGRAVDEQGVVRPRRCLGDPQGRSQGELVGRTLDERLERVARVESGLVEQRRAVGSSQGQWLVVGVDTRRIVEVRGQYGQVVPLVDDDVELAARRDDVVERLVHEREVPGQDAVADVVARHADSQRAAVGVKRTDAFERREPDRLGELASQLQRDGRPHLVLVAHLHLPALRPALIHTLVHSLWTTEPVSPSTVAPLSNTDSRGSWPFGVSGTVTICASAGARRSAWAAPARSTPRTPGANREAHLPAEHPSPCPQAWLPRPDAHASRSFDHQGPPAQGSDTAVGLIGRITERRAFERLSRDGRRAHTATLWCRYVGDRATVPPQLAFAIGRSVGSAVVRNRLRRRLRELIRAATVEAPPRLRAGLLVVGVKPGGGELSFDELGREVSELLLRVTEGSA